MWGGSYCTRSLAGCLMIQALQFHPQVLNKRAFCTVVLCHPTQPNQLHSGTDLVSLQTYLNSVLLPISQQRISCTSSNIPPQLYAFHYLPAHQATCTWSWVPSDPTSHLHSGVPDIFLVLLQPFIFNCTFCTVSFNRTFLLIRQRIHGPGCWPLQRRCSTGVHWYMVSSKRQGSSQGETRHVVCWAVTMLARAGHAERDVQCAVRDTVLDHS